MKLRDLKHRFEGFSDRMRGWPPIWVPGGPGPSDAFGADGVLESVSVRRLGTTLAEIRYKGREHMACLSWDPPPSLTDVEQALTSDQVPAELVAVADVKEDRAREKAEQYRVPYYLDYHEMLTRHPDIDVIDILTPTGYHARHVVDLARYAKHVVVEKPMALQVSDCDRMIAACRQHGCRLFVVKQNRYNRAVVAARRALDSERFGKLVMGTVRVRWKRDQAYYAKDPWRGTWELDGGVMAQQASHHLDLLQWFMGPVERLQCQIAT